MKNIQYLEILTKSPPARSSKNKRFIALLGAISLLLVFSCLSSGKNAVKPGIEAYGGLGRPEDPVPFMEKVRTGKLPGGLTYFLLENSKPENRAYLTLAVNAGSVLEKDDEQGLAHFVEHMAFNGTSRFPESELVNYLRSLGMRFGPEVNAYTSYDRTVYGIEVPTEAAGGAGKRVPDKALAVLDDWTRAIVFNPKDVDEERAIIMEEYRSHLGALERVVRKMFPLIFAGSPYAERLPIGLPEIIENAPAERLEAFYKRWYRADNMALIIVGDFDASLLEAELASHFSTLSPAEPLDRPRYDLPAPKKDFLQTTIITDPELTYTRIDLYSKRNLKAPGGDLASYREEIIDYLVERMLDFRFSEAVVKSDTPYVGAGAGNIRYGSSSRFYIMMAQAKAGAAEESVMALLKEKETMIRYGFTASELAIAKGALVSRLERQVSEKDRQESSGYVDRLTEYFLEGGAAPDVEWELEAAKKILPGIGAGDISAAVKDYFNPGDLRIFISAPESETRLPGEARVAELVRQSAAMKIDPPVERVLESEILPWQPAAGEIRGESVDKETGALVWELENGAKLILKETGNRNNEIVLFAMAKGGTMSASPEDFVSARLAMEMAEASGLGPYSMPDLVKRLADKQVSLGSWIDRYTRGFRGSATRGDLKSLFELLYLSFTDPRLDKGAIDAMIDQYRTDLAHRGESPETVFSDEVSRVISGGHPYYKPLETEDLPRVDMEKAGAFIKQGLNPGDYTFVFTGNLDIEAMRGLAETYIASIPPSASWNTWTDPQIRRPGKTERVVRKGQEEQSMVFMGWYDPMPFTEEASVAVSALNEYLDIRLTEDIREALGGVYSIYAGLSLSPAPKGELVMNVQFICDPKRADELSGAVEKLIRQTAQGPVNPDTFAKSIEALKKGWEASMQSNGYIAQSYANSSVLLDTPLSRLNKRPDLYGKVKPEEIQEICRRLLPRGPVKVVLLPENRR
ncbi:MAG: insulinase family protein [Treponema sp.]|jgi:zinc protease|nr:insulinase family protein [Treponema sp.]